MSRKGEEISEDLPWDVLTGIQGSYTLAGTHDDERQEIDEITVKHFLETLASSMQSNIHVWVFYGNNDHHKIEAALKALALSMKQAVAIDPRRKRIPSAKGIM